MCGMTTPPLTILELPGGRWGGRVGDGEGEWEMGRESGRWGGRVGDGEGRWKTDLDGRQLHTQPRCWEYASTL